VFVRVELATSKEVTTPLPQDSGFSGDAQGNPSR
jgi:hypothetical protein